MMQYFEMLDRSLLLFFNGLNTPVLDKIMWFITGTVSWIPLYIFIIFLYFKQFKRKGFLIVLISIITVALCDLVSVNLFKEVFERYRPSQNLEIHHLIHTVKHYRGGLYGFVSSHAANGFGIATISSLIINKKWYYYLIFIWATTISISRLYLGVHYPGDIIGGALLGISIGYLMYFALKINKKVLPS